MKGNAYTPREGTQYQLKAHCDKLSVFHNSKATTQKVMANNPKNTSLKTHFSTQSTEKGNKRMKIRCNKEKSNLKLTIVTVIINGLQAAI